MSVLTSLNRCSENVAIEAVVVSELKLRDVQRQIFLADLVEATDNSALEDAPKAFNRVRVNCADDVRPLVVDAPCGTLGASIGVCPAIVGANRLTLSEIISFTKPSALSRVDASITRAMTLPLRSTAPMTGILPEARAPRSAALPAHPCS